MLNEEQQLFVYDNEFKYRKLYGVPGGGKTRCIIEKLCFLKQSGMINNANDYLVLTFSRRACEDFIKKGKIRNSVLFNSKNIRTIHSACSSILSESYMNISTIVHECSEALKKDENFIKENWSASKKIIIIDEAQDISSIQYDFVCMLGRIYSCPVILVGDPNQTIFQFQNGSDKFLLNHEGDYINLKVNYRSCGSIVCFLNNFRPWESYGYITSQIGREAGKKPTVITGDIEECLHHMWKKILCTKEALHNIAIIAPIKLSKSYALSLSVIANFLDQMNIPFIKHYQDSEQDSSYKKSKEPSFGKINLYTIHGSKGLEFKKVFLCNFHFYTKAYRPTKAEFLEDKYLWYVGMSRAINELYIYGLSDNILFPTLYACPSYLYTANNQIIEKPYQFNEVSTNENQTYSVKSFISTKTILEEDKLSALHNLFKYTTHTEDIYTVNVELYEYDSYSILYGMFIEEWVFYKNADINTYIASKKRWFDAKVPLSKYLWRLMSPSMKKVHYYTDFIRIMNHERDIDNDILKIIQKTLVNRDDYFEFCIDNNVCTYNQGTYYSYLDGLRNSSTAVESVWKVVLYNYQLNYECKYLLKTDFTNHFITLQPYINEINKITAFNANTLFQIPIIDSDIHLKGVIDALDEENVIHEFKFCQDISLQDYVQVFLYSLIHYNELKDKKAVLWNLQKGEKHIINFTSDNSNEIRTFLQMI